MTNDIYSHLTDEDYANEVWKDIEEYEGLYQVSNIGRVKSLDYNHTKQQKILKPNKTSSGYLQVSLCNSGKRKNKLIHRLVCYAFIHNDDEEKTEVNHLNGKLDNRTFSLEWVTSAGNKKHAWDNELYSIGEKHQCAKISDNSVNIIRKLYSYGGFSQQQLADLFDISRPQVGNIVNNRQRKYPTPVLETL